MNQCVPSWDLDDNHATARHSLRTNSNSTAADVRMPDYEVAELTWENGQLAMHGLGPARVPAKPLISNALSKYNTWDKPRANGTLESIVNQATRVPSEEDNKTPGVGGSRLGGCSTRVGSCSVPTGARDNEVFVSGKRSREATGRVPVTPEWSGKEQSASASATFGRDSQYVTFDTYEKDLGVGFTSASLGSPENTSSTKPNTRATTTTADDHDSVCHSTPQRERMEEDKKETGKSSVSKKEAELLPSITSLNTDKASMLDEVIDYLKQLQAQVHMMNRMNIPPPMMLPMAMQQQLQMSMMAPAMGMGMGVMDMNGIVHPNIAGISPVIPNPFMNMTSWDGSGERLQQAASAAMPDPLSLFLAYQSQPMNMDAYSRLAAMYQQRQQPPASGFKS
ncbi:hypothetical protein F3Y22_tig00000764pilonHSYRG00124 [Hibiscus syriacus]|uniref:Transcription factor UNE10 n=1 Tax=Hibiscus syriacus TaxID=106335 RepID=A0A6A3CZB0_HIBSY|nr:hypothetical protein F3Y22_tig00000764pilonHSYRG00124 [Hibiscus syriacus]